MRKLLIAIAILGGVASIALCSSYGWDQATMLKDQITAAFVYGMGAVFSLVLHVLAIRVWVSGWRKCAAAIGFAGFLAFVMTAFTSLGGLASRSDHVLAERQGELDAKASVKRQIDELVAERAGLVFKRTSQTTVDAAKLAADAAKQTRQQECEKVGVNCRKRQDAEADALTALAKAQENKASTERFDQIETELKGLRSRKGEATVASADPVKTLLTAIVGTWADLLTAWQKAVFAVVYDVCLIAVMIGIEVLGHTAYAPSPAVRTAHVPKQPTVDITPAVLDAPDAEPELAEQPIALSPKPRLVSEEKSRSKGVAAYLAERLQPKPGVRVEMEECQAAYASSGLRPLTTREFVESLQHFCRACGVKTKLIRDKVYLMDVELTERSGAMASRLGNMGRDKRGS